MNDVIPDFKSFVKDTITMVAAFEVSLEANYLAMLGTIANADNTYWLTEQGAAEQLTKDRADAVKGLSVSCSIAEKYFWNSEATFRETFTKDWATAKETLDNSMAAADRDLIQDETTAQTTFQQAFSTQVVDFQVDLANNEQQFASDIANAAVTWVTNVSAALTNEYITQSGFDPDVITVAGAFDSYNVTVANEWRGLTNSQAAAWTAYATAEAPLWKATYDSIAGADATRIDGVAGHYVTYSTSVNGAAKTYNHTMAGHQTTWTNSVVGARDTMNQSIAEAARVGNRAMATAERTREDGMQNAAHAYFTNGIPLRQTLFTDSTNASRDTSRNLVDQQATLWGGLVSAKQTRALDELLAEKNYANGVLGLAPGVISAKAQVIESQEELGAQLRLDNIQNTPVSQFAGMGAFASSAPTALIMSLMMGAGDYRSTFLGTLPQQVQDAIKSADPKSTIWRVHHRYQQAEGMELFLQKFKGENFDLNSTQHTRILPEHIHRKISNEQNDWWRLRFSALDNPRGLDFSIAHTIDLTPDNGKQKLFREFEKLVADQDQFFSKFWLGQGAKAANFEKLASNLNLKGGTTLVETLQMINSPVAREAFEKLHAPRYKQFLRGLGETAKKLGITKIPAKIGVGVGIGIALYSLNEQKAALADDAAINDLVQTEQRILAMQPSARRADEIAKLADKMKTFLDRMQVDGFTIKIIMERLYLISAEMQ